MTTAVPLAGALLAAISIGTAVAAPPPSRIVSINLCTDELLLTLADADQIAALSPYATDGNLSLLADRARHFRHDAGRAEIVVALKPDLVLAGRFSDQVMQDILKRLDYPVIAFEVARTIEESIAQIREVAALVGHPDRGERLAAAITAAETRARAAAGDRPAASAVFYQRRGYTTGGNTLTAQLMALVGLANLGEELAGADGGFVPLERLVAARPDYLVVDSTMTTAEDQGSALLLHPALEALYPPAKRIVLPERLTVCGSPSLAAAIDWLSAEVDRVVSAKGQP
jgi:iron complex transport system substrate-binding protein